MSPEQRRKLHNQKIIEESRNAKTPKELLAEAEAMLAVAVGNQQDLEALVQQQAEVNELIVGLRANLEAERAAYERTWWRRLRAAILGPAEKSRTGS